MLQLIKMYQWLTSAIRSLMYFLNDHVVVVIFLSSASEHWLQRISSDCCFIIGDPILGCPYLSILVWSRPRWNWRKTKLCANRIHHNLQTGYKQQTIFSYVGKTAEGGSRSGRDIGGERAATSAERQNWRWKYWELFGQ